MKPFPRVKLLLCCIGLLLAQPACTQPAQQDSSNPEKVALCTGCGQIKDSADCCKADQPLCAKCGLAKGAPGCCRITKGSSDPTYLCAHCGFIKGSEDCCKSGKPSCGKCGLAKGSPGCCRIAKSG